MFANKYYDLVLIKPDNFIAQADDTLPKVCPKKTEQDDKTVADDEPISPSVLERKASFQQSTEDLMTSQAAAAGRLRTVPPRPTVRSTSVGILDKPTGLLYRQQHSTPAVQRSSSVVTPPSPRLLNLGGESSLYFTCVLPCFSELKETINQRRSKNIVAQSLSCTRILGYSYGYE